MNNARYTVLLFLGLERINRYKMRASTTSPFGFIVYKHPFKEIIPILKNYYPEVWNSIILTDKEYKLYRLIHETL